jgi:hypothetical protein
VNEATYWRVRVFQQANRTPSFKYTFADRPTVDLTQRMAAGIAWINGQWRTLTLQWALTDQALLMALSYEEAVECDADLTPP